MKPLLKCNHLKLNYLKLIATKAFPHAKCFPELNRLPGKIFLCGWTAPSLDCHSLFSSWSWLSVSTSSHCSLAELADERASLASVPGSSSGSSLRCPSLTLAEHFQLQSPLSTFSVPWDRRSFDSFPDMQKHHYLCRAQPRLSWTQCTVLPSLWPCHASRCQLVRPDVLATSRASRDMYSFLHNPPLRLLSLLTHTILSSSETKGIFSSLPWAQFSTAVLLAFWAGWLFVSGGGADLYWLDQEHPATQLSGDIQKCLQILPNVPCGG